MDKPDYKAFARDMMRLCRRHGVKMSAGDEGLVILGPAKAKVIGDSPYSFFQFSPTQAVLGDEGDDDHIKLTAE